MSEGGSEGGEGESVHAEGGEEHASEAENSHNTKGKGDKKSKDRSDDTIHGSVAIIYYEDPETGKVEFYLEEKPQDYFIPQYRGKLAFVGGTIKHNETNIEALLRELGEEVQNSNAQSILQHILLSRGLSYYDVLRQIVGGEASRTYVYIIKVNSRAEWETIRNSPLTHDAGPKRVLTLEELVELLESDSSAFAFEFDKVLIKFINQFYGARISDYKAKISSTAARKQQGYLAYLRNNSEFNGHQTLYPIAVNTNNYYNTHPVFGVNESKLEDRIKQNSYYSKEYKKYRMAA